MSLRSLFSTLILLGYTIFRLSSKYTSPKSPLASTKHTNLKRTIAGKAEIHDVYSNQSSFSFPSDIEQSNRSLSPSREIQKLYSATLSDKPLSTKTNSTDLDSGMGSSSQQSQMTSLANSFHSDFTPALPSRRCEFELPRVSDRSESIQTQSRASYSRWNESESFCGEIIDEEDATNDVFTHSKKDEVVTKNNIGKEQVLLNPEGLNAPRNNIYSIRSDVLLNDLLHFKGM